MGTESDPPHIDDWLLMGNFLYPTLLTIFYLLIFRWVIVHTRRKLGRRGTWDRFGAEIILIYMCGMTLAHGYLLFFMIFYSIQLNYSLLKCNNPTKFFRSSRYTFTHSLNGWFTEWVYEGSDEDEETIKAEIQLAKLFWWYMVSKVGELIQQPIYLLKYPDYVNRLSYWDTGHHVTMVVVSWAGLKMAPGGSSIIWTTISCAFLLLTYLHQTVKRMSVYSKILDIVNRPIFKSVITTAKLTQFLLAGGHCIVVLLAKDGTCRYPKLYAGVLLAFILLVFGEAYYKLKTSGRGGATGGNGGGNMAVRRDEGSDDDEDTGYSDCSDEDHRNDDSDDDNNGL